MGGFVSPGPLTYLPLHRPRDRNTSANRWCWTILAATLTGTLHVLGQLTQGEKTDERDYWNSGHGERCHCTGIHERRIGVVVSCS